MISLQVNGAKRVIKKVRIDNESEIDADYKGHHIQLRSFKHQLSPAEIWDLTVAGKDGCLIVDTTEYCADKSRTEMLALAIENILYVPSES